MDWLNWDDAQAECEKDSAHLLSWSTSEEASFYSDRFRFAWFGGRRKQGSWEWVDGSAVNFFTLGLGGLNGLGDCLMTANGVLYDRDCSLADSFVCQKEQIVLNK